MEAGGEKLTSGSFRMSVECHETIEGIQEA